MDDAAAFKEKLRSLSFRATPAASRTKRTVHHTDTAVVTETEHWHDRQDVNVAITEPVRGDSGQTDHR